MSKQGILSENQISIFDFNEKEKERLDSNLLPVVKATFSLFIIRQYYKYIN